MAKEYRCQLSICDEVAAAMRLSPETVAAYPKSWKLCVAHLALTIGDCTVLPKRIEARRQKHPIYGSDEPMRCYGEAGTCQTYGDLYPGGRYCEAHKPH